MWIENMLHFDRCMCKWCSTYKEKRAWDGTELGSQCWAAMTSA